MNSKETVTVEVQVRPYEPEHGVLIWRDNDERVLVQLKGDSIVIEANQRGLHALARHLLTLAQQGVLDGSDVYLQSNGQGPTLEHGSLPLHLVRADESEREG